MVNRDACSPGQYYDLLKGCQFCSLINSMYQEMLCPCESFRDAVVACKLAYEGSVLCRPRNSAVEECAKRGYTSSLAPRTTASADSTVMPSVASSGSGSTIVLPGESTQLRFATSANIDNLPLSTSSDAAYILIFSTSACVIGLLLCAAIVGFLWIRHQRKIRRRRMQKYEDEKGELRATRAKLIDKEVACHGDVNGITTPQVVIINGATPDVDRKPSSVVNNYSIVVKDSQFTQVGSQNVMNVAEQIAGVVGSAGDWNNDEEEQMSPASGSSDPGDENDMVFDNASNSNVFWHADFSHLPAEQPEFTQFAPVVQSGITDHLEEGDAYPRNLEKNTETEKHGFTSLGSQRCGIENARRDNSSMPTQNTDSFSQWMDGTAKAPFSQLTGVSSNSVHPGPLPSTAGDRYDAPTVSESVRRTDGTTLLMPLTSQSSAPLSKGGQCSLNSRDHSNSCVLVRPSARKSLSAGRSSLRTAPVQNSDKDPNLPLQTSSLRSVPLGIGGVQRQIVSPVS